ncbi:hypothetical protein [Symbiopectobacterium purcellii]|uniref:Uncharacterized protein n=1 Tax=Symbiopectobacterium purcellii TaxID=2871826 RepID=A0ABX9ATS7_9ENTR|nr:hypothetical protein [Symbiopectobacterium purcellii]QZN97771.1 hypothetical protein K6K13_10960 [Symbiopectobacterium purcellii]
MNGSVYRDTYTTAAREMAEQATFNRLSKSMPEAAAHKLAKETADRAAAVAGKTAFVGTMASTAQGQGGIDMHDEINALSFNELMNSSSFQKAFTAIDTDPNNSNLDDMQKTDNGTQPGSRAGRRVSAMSVSLSERLACNRVGCCRCCGCRAGIMGRPQIYN